MAPITLITDSRGMYLENYFPNHLLRYVDIRYFPGMTLRELSTNLPRWRFLRQTRKVYIMLGINDCTVLERATHTVRLVTPYASGIFVRLKTVLAEIETIFKRDFPTVRITFCPLYGLDVGRYNKSPLPYRYQDSLDQAIILINSHISRTNARNRSRTPFLCNVIHRLRPKHHIYIHLYERLIDGLHPGGLALKKISEYLTRCIAENL